MAAIIDYRGKTPTKTPSGVPLITAKVVKGGRIERPDEFIAEEDYEAWMRRGMPEPGDVVITTEAPLGEVAQLGNERVALAQRLIALRGKRGVLDNTFLKFLMQSRNVQDQLLARASGTTVFGIRQSELRKITLTLPPFTEQRALAKVLGTLDDKIDLNTRMNETLEGMALALFKSWFLDFDPARAKAEGCNPGLPEPLADLYPSSFENSELGQIPTGWKTGTLGDMVELLREQEDPLSSGQTTFQHYSIPAFDNGQCPISELGANIKSFKFKVPTGVVLLSKLNPEIERVWLVDVHADDRAVCSTEFLVLNPRAPFGRGYAYCLARSSVFRQQIEALVTGTSKSHQRAQADTVLRLPVILPPRAVVEKFETLSSNFLGRVIACRRESWTLAAVRDALLPKLISGELRIPDTDRIVGEQV